MLAAIPPRQPPRPRAADADEPAGDGPSDLRSRLEAAGIKVEATWYADWTRTLDGGLRPHDTTRRTFLDVDLTVDTDALLGVAGGKFRCELWRIDGQSRRDGSGAIQDPSGLAAERRIELGQIWYEQKLERPQLRLRVGKFDPTYDFAVVEGGWDFLNSGVTYAPNLTGVPVYPDTAYGAELFWDPDPALHVAVGVFDGALQEGVPTGRRGPSSLFGAPADLCVLGEVRTRWTAGPGELAGTAVVGGWHHNGTFRDLDGARNDRTGGAYLVVEQQILRESPDDPDDAQGIATFARTTVAERGVGDVRRHDGAGVVWRGLFDGRDDDTTGLAFLRADTDAATRRRPETVVELFHKFQLTPGISITPDLQYVRHPFGAPGEDGALVAGLRLVVVF